MAARRMEDPIRVETGLSLADDSTVSIAAGWYPDPYAPEMIRYWSGEAWTHHTSPAIAATPYASAPVHPNLQHASGSVAAFTAAPATSVAASKGKAADVWLPPGMVQWGGLPPVCTKHGRRASRMSNTTIYSRTPLWVIPIIVLSMLVGLIVALAIRKTVTGIWPFCPECERNRRSRVTGMWIALVTALAAVALGVAAHVPGLLLLALVAAVVSAGYGCLSSWTNQTCAEVDRTSVTVHVRKPSAAFVASLPRV